MIPALWLALLLIPQPVIAAGCLVGNFKGTVMSTQPESSRAAAALKWLKSEAEDCSAEKIQIIRNNSASWLGTALNPEIESVLEGLIEAKSSNNPDVLKALFEDNPARAAAQSPGSSTVYKTPTPRAPVVPQTIIGGSVSGSYTNIVINPDSSKNNASGNKGERTPGLNQSPAQAPVPAPAPERPAAR